MSLVEVEGRRLRLTSLDKVLWPAAGFTKGAMLDYYARVAPALLPHLAGRALTMRRFPEGVEARGWYQDDCRGAPAWLRTHPEPTREGRVHRFCVVDDLPSLLFVANLGTIELHPFLARAARWDEPTAVVFDLDPGPPADVLDCCRVALRLRDALAALGLEAVVKTSGVVGLHVEVPVGGGVGYGETKAFARALAGLLVREDPERVVDRQRRELRAGRVLVDWLQNDSRRSTVAPYSLRALGWPTVSTPLAWDEVEDALAAGRPERLTFEPDAVLARLERLGDLFAPALTLEQALPRT